MVKFSDYRLTTFFGAIIILLAGPVSAQTVGGGSELLYQWDGAAALDHLGQSVSGAGDVNGDGFDDLVVGVRFANPGGLEDAGSTFVYSGADGSLLYQWDGGWWGDYFGRSVAGAGDVNGDGFADVIVGAPKTNRLGFKDVGTVYVYSGADGSRLHYWIGGTAYEFFGTSVSGAGDINGDGFADLIVGSISANPGGLNNAGSVFVFSGFDGTVLHQWDGGVAFNKLGVSVSGAGDVDADGVPDVIVGAGAGYAYTYSGANGSLLYQWGGGVFGSNFGGSVSAAGDVNSDGFDDVLVGASGTDSGMLSSAGAAFIYSGADGTQLLRWYGGASGEQLGISLSDVGDVNGDGVGEVIVGAHGVDPGGLPLAGAASLYSGVDGALIHRWDGEGAYDSFGLSVSGAGDVNGDGFPDVIMGAFHADPGGVSAAGSAYVYNCHPYLQANTTTISAFAGGVLDLDLNFPDSAALQEYITLMSTVGIGPTQYGVDIPLSLDDYLLDSAVGIYPFTIASNLHGTLDASGNATASITFPAGVYNFAIGRTFWLAAVTFPTGQLPAQSSVAVAVEVVP